LRRLADEARLWTAAQARGDGEEADASYGRMDEIRLGLDRQGLLDEDRCRQLRGLCRSTGARRVLEVGSFCGVASLAMAEVLPEDGEVVSLELDQFAVDFGAEIKARSEAAQKVLDVVGPAQVSLDSFKQRALAADGLWQPFDLAVIDADKAGMLEYFRLLWETPGLLSEGAVVCVDVTPFKGQLFRRYVQHGKPDEWLVSSGQGHIEALKQFVKTSGHFHATERAGLVTVEKVQQTEAHDVSVGAHPLAHSISVGAHPLASFPNDHGGVVGLARWAAPQSGGPLEELRKAVATTDWASLFAEGATKVRAEASWSASASRLQQLRSLCAEVGARRVLEVGSFCGVAALAMAEALPEGGRVHSLELEPFFAEFSRGIKARSQAAGRLTCTVGPALSSLQELAERAGAPSWEPFDLALVDADKACMADYFRILWETPGMMTENATICIDTTPFKGQLFVRYVKQRRSDDWFVESGKGAVAAFRALARALPGAEFAESGGLAVVRRQG